MFEHFLTAHLWIASGLWALSYISDYALTLYTARLYHAGARQHFGFGGSFELTPYFQSDIDKLRRLSPRFWLALLLSMVTMGLVWVLSVAVLRLPTFFTFLIGAMLLRQAAVHLRHARNLVLFRAVRDTSDVSGQITYARPLVLKLSSAEFGAYGLLYLILALVTGSWFVLGGAVSCAVVSVQHWRLALAARTKTHAA